MSYVLFWITEIAIDTACNKDEGECVDGAYCKPDATPSNQQCKASKTLIIVELATVVKQFFCPTTHLRSTGLNKIIKKNYCLVTRNLVIN